MKNYNMPLESLHFGKAVITKVESLLSDGSKVYSLELSGVIDTVDSQTADNILACLEDYKIELKAL